MWEAVGLRAFWFAIGVMFCLFILSTIYGRRIWAFLKESIKREERSELRESRSLAILEHVNKDAIREFAEDIDKTTQLRRSRPLDV